MANFLFKKTKSKNFMPLIQNGLVGWQNSSRVLIAICYPEKAIYLISTALINPITKLTVHKQASFSDLISV